MANVFLCLRRIVIVAIAIAALSPGLTGQAETPVDPESYAVYRALIPNDLTGDGHIILRRETVTYSRCFPRGRPLDEEWKPVVEDFKLQNLQPRTLEAGFDIGREYLLVPWKDLQTAFTQLPGGSWWIFFARYPNSGGYIDVSAVGFDSTKTRAMVYVAHHCGQLCGRGAFHLMEKADGQWREAFLKNLEYCLWIS
jgi:hypothetical protein